VLLLLLQGGFAWQLYLNLFGLERLNVSGCGLLSNSVSVSALLNAKSECDQVGSGGHKGHVEGIARVEIDRVGSSLRARPEGVASTVSVVFREDMQQVKDLVVKHGLKILA
jgi:hypothetical protein